MSATDKKKEEDRKLMEELKEARGKLKDINVAINRDTDVLKKLGDEIKEKENKILWLNNEIEAKSWELDAIKNLVDLAEEDFGKDKEKKKEEINKLVDKRKKEEEKCDMIIGELKNDIKVLEGRKEWLNNEIIDMEKDLKKALADKDNEINSKENEIIKLNDKINEVKLKYEDEENKYNRKLRDVKELEEKMEELNEVEEKIEKCEEVIEWKMQELNETKECVLWYQEKKKMIENEIKDLESNKIKLEKECENYVKMKMEIKERKDELDAREKYIRKRYEEAWIKF